MEWEELQDRLSAFLFPKRCIVCDEIVAYEDCICKKCSFEALGIIETDNILTAVLAAASYDGNIKNILREMKRSAMYWEHRFFAQILAENIFQHWPEIKWSCIVPVPTSAGRFKKRKFNQAERLARALNKRLHSEIRTDILMRKTDSLAQHKLSKAARKKNAEYSYALIPHAFVAGTVLLVDDIYTTGSTVDACAKLLLQAGADKVYAVIAARTNQEQAI